MSTVARWKEYDADGRPIPAALRWLLERAEWLCQCGGNCGARHEAVCSQSVHSDVLIAAPADVALSPAEAAAVPIEDLVVWCRSCLAEAERLHRAARREVQRIEAAALADLFGGGLSVESVAS
jgi:hypothetical protein